MTSPRAKTALAGTLLAAICAAPLGAQSRAALADILARGVTDFGVQGQDARVVLEGIGAAYNFTKVA